MQWDWYAVKAYKSIDRLMCESKNSRVRKEAGSAGTAALPSSLVSAIEQWEIGFGDASSKPISKTFSSRCVRAEKLELPVRPVRLYLGKRKRHPLMLSADVLKLVAGLAVAYVWELTACRPARPQLQLPLRNVLGLGACTTPPPSSNATAKSAALNTWPPVPVIPLPVASLLAGHHQDRDLVLFLWDSVFCVAVVLGVLLLFKFFGAVDLATSLWTDRVTARLNLRPHARLAVESAFKNLMWRFVENDVALLFGGLLVCLVYNASTTLGAGVTAALAVAVVGVVLLLLSRRYAALFGLVALIPAIGLAALQMLPADAQPSLGDALGTALNFALSAAAEPLNWDVLVLAAMMPCVSVPLCIAQDLIIPAKWRVRTRV